MPALPMKEIARALTRFRYDVVLRVDHRAASACADNNSLVPDMKHWASEGRPLATDPMAAAFLQHLGMALGNALRAEFPDAQLPAAVIALNRRDFAEIVPALVLAPSDPDSHEAAEASA